MSHGVVVTGYGVISALGNSPTKLHEALCEGRRGFDLCGDVPSSGGLRNVGKLGSFSVRDHLQGGNFRSLDRTAQLAASAAAKALEASGWTEEMRQDHEVGLVMGTMFGSLHTTSSFDRRARVAGATYAKPMDFANSVINAPAAQTAIWHQLRGVNTALMGGPAAGLAAVAYAVDLIRAGTATAILVTGADEICFETLLGLERAGLLCGGDGKEADLPRPFDARRSGFVAAEGGACLMLEEKESARSRGAIIAADLLGQSTHFDVSRGREEGRAVEAASRSARQALYRARIDAVEVDVWSAGANGSPASDRIEARAITETFGASIAPPPITAIKSTLGETMGASGLFQVIDLIESMHTASLPGIRGLDQPEEDFPLDRSASRTREITASLGLIQAASLDGLYCSLVLRRRGQR